MERVEAGDAAWSPQVARTDEIGLLQIPGVARSGSGIGFASAPDTTGRLFRVAVALEDALNGAQRGQRPNPAPLQLQPDRLSSDSREPRTPRAMCFEFLAEGQHPCHHAGRHGARAPLRGPTPGLKPRPTFGAKPVQPLGQPDLAAAHALHHGAERDTSQVQFDRSTPKRILMVFPRHRALPDNSTWESVASGGRAPTVPATSAT